MSEKKISQLPQLSAPSLDDLIALVDDPSGTPVTKKIPLSAVFLDEDNMASDSAVQGATQQSIKAYVDNVTKTICLPAGAMSPTTTSGCAELATVEAGTNDIDYKVLDFDQTTQENAFSQFVMPDSWDGGAVQIQFVWTAASGSGNVVWGAKGRSFADSDAIDQAYGSAQTVTDGLITAADVHFSSFTNDITLAGTPAGGQMVQLKLYRDAASGSDTLNADARLIAINIKFGIDANTD